VCARSLIDVQTQLPKRASCFKIFEGPEALTKGEWKILLSDAATLPVFPGFPVLIQREENHSLYRYEASERGESLSRAHYAIVC
jgi:hypothetical protein